jgi:hypothetical protein
MARGLTPFDRVVISRKVDLDTVGVAFLLGVTRGEKVTVVNGSASEADLADPSVLCIEVGGAGQVVKLNFDHHEAGGPVHSATWQAAYDMQFCFCGWAHWGLIDPKTLGMECYPHSFLDLWEKSVLPVVSKLVSYIDELDTMGPEALRRRTGGNVDFPTFSDVFAGLLLTERDPVEQLHEGVKLLIAVVDSGQDPYGTIRGFNSYAAAKAENDRQVRLAVESAEWDSTQGGRKLAFLETEFFGAPGALYGVGAEVVVCFSPRFGNPPVPKFTVAGNGIRVDAALPALNALEEGWGGPATGTIIGSPRSGSRLTLKEVVEVVKQAL